MKLIRLTRLEESEGKNRIIDWDEFWISIHAIPDPLALTFDPLAKKMVSKDFYMVGKNEGWLNMS